MLFLFHLTVKPIKTPSLTRENIQGFLHPETSQWISTEKRTNTPFLAVELGMGLILSWLCLLHKPHQNKK